MSTTNINIVLGESTIFADINNDNMLMLAQPQHHYSV